MKHKITKVLSGIIAMVLMLLTPIEVKALEGDDYTVQDQGEGTIRLSLIYEDDVNNTRVQTPLKNVEISLYQVWTYNDRLVSFTDAFKDAGVELNGKMSAKEIQDTTSKFSALKGNAPVFKTAQSDANGNVEFNGLPFGGYLVVQEGEIIQDDAKYEMSDFLVTLPYKVEDTGEWTADFTVGPEDPKLNVDAAIAPKFVLKKTVLPPVKVRKIASDTKKDLKGATLAIKDKTGKEFIKDENGKELVWETDGKVKEIDLDPGIYTLTEISAPKGYQLATNIKFVVNEDNTVNLLDTAGNIAKKVDVIVMEDIKKVSGKKPTKTNDNMNMPLYIGIFGGALLIIFLALWWRRKAEK